MSICGIVIRGKAGILSRIFRRDNSLRFRLMHGVSWSFAGTATSGAVGLLQSIVLARMLGVTRFGEFGLINNTLITFSVFAGPALGLTATKHLAELRSLQPLRAARILRLTTLTAYAVSALTSVAIFLSAPYLASSSLHAPALVSEVRMAGVALFFYGLNGAQGGILAGLEAFKRLSAVNALRAGSTLISCWLGARVAGLSGAVAGLALGAIFTFAVTSWTLRRLVETTNLPRNIDQVWTESRVLYTFTAPAFLAVFVTLIATWLGNVLLVQTSGGYKQMALFTVATQWRLLVFFLPAVMLQPFTSVLANLVGHRALASYQRVVRASILSTTLSAAVPAGLILCLTRQICSLYGAGYREAAGTLAVYIVGSVLSAPTLAVVQVITTLGNQWYAFALNGIWAMAFLLASLLLVNKGALGIAQAFLIANVIHLITNCGVMSRLLSRAQLANAEPSVCLP